MLHSSGSQNLMATALLAGNGSHTKYQKARFSKVLRGVVDCRRFGRDASKRP
jgi:hypothetical protein